MALTFKQLNNGRSMIEMLAVLVIMGILTLGGIAGYRYAMNKSTANAITKEVSLRAASIMNDGTFSRYQINAPIAALGFKGQIGTFTYEQTKSSTTTFTVTVSPVSQPVCRRIAEMAHPNALSVSINEQTWQEGDTFLCSSDENTIDFVFAAIPQGQMLTDFACGPCYEQSGDDCIYKCVGNQVCSDAGCVCPPDTPVGADPIYCTCRGNKVPNSSNVCACPGNMTDPDGDNTCTCPSPTTYWNGVECVCPTGTPTGADPETCACPGNKINQNGQCVCPGNMTDPDGDNTCTCPSPTTYWNGSQCVCPTGTPTGADPETCACPGNKINQNGQCVCPGNMTDPDGDNTCTCPSPTTYWNGSQCVCPTGTPTGADPETCACPGNKINQNGQCVCPGNMTDPDGDNTCTCPSPTTYWNGAQCVCPIDTPTGADPETCACPEGMIEDVLTNKCVSACEDPTPYWDIQTQTCVACLADENCDTCYTCQDKTCVKKECELTCPEGMSQGEDECGCPTSCCCTQEEVDAGAICLDGVCKQAYCDPTKVLCSQAKCPDGMRLMTREEALSVANAHTYNGPCNANWTSSGHTMVCGYRVSPYERIIVDLTGSWDASSTNCLNENYGNAGKYWWHGSCGNPTVPSTGTAFTFCIEK